MVSSHFQREPDKPRFVAHLMDERHLSQRSPTASLRGPSPFGPGTWAAVMGGHRGTCRPVASDDFSRFQECNIGFAVIIRNDKSIRMAGELFRFLARAGDHIGLGRRHSGRR